MFDPLGLNTTTPKSVTPEIMALCRQLDASQHPSYLEVRPELTCNIDNCFFNVQERVERDGGSVVYGWTIWESPSVLIEAEFHAVWDRGISDLIDITAKRDGETQILFLRDSTREWQGEPVDNVRMLLDESTEYKRAIEISKELYLLRKRYFTGRVSNIPLEEIRRLYASFGIIDATRAKIRRNDQCPCGSGRKYKMCCKRRAQS